MDYQSIKPSFARHETFGLRYSWLPKGYKAFNEHGGSAAFTDDEATVRLGVGKNMVSSIMYWLQATGIVGRIGDPFITTFGEELLGRFDTYLEDDGSLQLLHWKLCTNPELALAFYWFFGRYHALSFTSEEVNAAFKDFCRGRIGVKVNDSSIEKDINMVLRMYAPQRKRKDSVEDQFDNPMAQLNLTHFNAVDGRYLKPVNDNPELPVDIFAYVISDFASQLNNGSVAVSLDDLMKGRECLLGPASCFCLSQSGTIYMLEKVQKKYPQFVDLKEQSGSWQLYFHGNENGVKALRDRSLENYYQGSNE